jgi:hypothetical protein
MDVINIVVASFFQFTLGVIPFAMFLHEWATAGLWLLLCGCTALTLYFTWYKHLPSPEET